MSKKDKHWVAGMLIACIAVYAIAKHHDQAALADLAGAAALS